MNFSKRQLKRVFISASILFLLLILVTLFTIFLSRQVLKTGVIKINGSQLGSVSESFFSDKIAPFYKITSYSLEAPSDSDLVEVPNLTLRDNILLREDVDVVVSLYKINEDASIKSAPIFLVQVGPEKNYQYVAGEYGAGSFVLVTNSLEKSCANILLEDCILLEGFLNERRYKVISDTYTYVFAPSEKKSVAKINTEKLTEMLIIEPKGMAETVKDVVIDLFSNTTTYTNDAAEVISSEADMTTPLNPDSASSTPIEQPAEILPLPEEVMPQSENETGE